MITFSLCSSHVHHEWIKQHEMRIREVTYTESHEQVWPGCLVCCLEPPSWGSNLFEHQWEFDFRIVELLGTLPFAQLSRDGGSLNYLDAWMPHSMTRCHFIVHLLNSTIQSRVTVLLVHIMITSATLISQPNSIVLNLGRILLKDLQSEQKLNLHVHCPAQLDCISNLEYRYLLKYYFPKEA